MDASQPGRLLGEFPAHSYEEWKDAAIKLLKGRSFEKTLITPTYEGFDLQPVYTRDELEKIAHTSDLPGRGSHVRGSRLSGFLEKGWSVSQELSAPTPAALNAILLEAINRGQDELNIRPDAATRSGINADTAKDRDCGTCGVSLCTRNDLKELLKGVDLGKTSLYLQSRQATPSVYALLMAALKEMSTDPSLLTGCLGMDPVGSLAETGTATSEIEDVLDVLAGLLKHSAQTAPHLQVLDIQGHVYHNGGASSSQEMAAILGSVVFYLNALTARGLAPAEIVKRMRLSVSIGGDYFIEIAKLRALRLLWNRVMDAYGIDESERSIHVHARTGLWNKTVFDPYVNMLRTTTEAFSAVVGGCDSLHVGPFDEVLREADSFSRRIAANTHTILAEECDMRRVIDPAGGSWAVESLTDQIAASAWKLFQQIESDGGIVENLIHGIWQQSVEEVRASRIRNIQCRKDVIVGTNTYPNPTEKLLKPAEIDYTAAVKERRSALADWKRNRDNSAVFTLLEGVSTENGAERIDAMIAAAAAGATLAELQSSAGLGTLLNKAQPIKASRAAAEFEKLRMAANVMTGQGKPPVIHQLNIGPSRRYRIRADWTSAFFQAGGIKVLNEDDYEDVDASLQALRESGARVAIITSDDETYASVVGPLATAIKEYDSGISVYVAGAPSDNEQAWKQAGVDDFVHIRVNNYLFNEQLLRKLGADL